MYILFVIDPVIKLIYFDNSAYEYGKIFNRKTMKMTSLMTE